MSQWSQVEQIFAEALSRPPEERTAFLRSQCDDEKVREEVASLLDAREEAPAFFSAASAAVTHVLGASDDDQAADAQAFPSDLNDQQVGSYRLTEEIGVGGMSVVYRAERAGSEFERTVAVKLLQRRLHAESAEQRFRAERQVLASLDHPNIAQLIDGGLTEGGRPYLVMEHVDGVPITTYADERGLGVAERLDLLEQVFDAVAAAHRQLVVHRDLKPSNVLVTETGDRPQVKLLDFGIAKLMGEALPITRPETRTGQYLMTPAYAAPEQVAGDEITTATDVYQLGVLAYELLVGARPFALTGKSLTEIERILLESIPEPPSTAAQDQNRPTAGELEGDLDTILLKALRKEPQRRYQSVKALATDLERYRKGEPVQAGPTTIGYRARKFVARNRAIVGTAAALLVLLAVYAATVTIQASRLAKQRNRARTQTQKAEHVSSFLVDLMSRANPYNTIEESVPDLTVRRVMDRGRKRIGELEGQPAVQAKLRTVMGRIYDQFGLFDKAESLLTDGLAQRRRLREGPDAKLATSMYRLGVHYRATGDAEDADRLLHSALDMRRNVHGGPHPSIAEVLEEIGRMSWRTFGEYAKADSVLQEALRMRRVLHDSAHVSIASSLNAIGQLYHEQGKYPQAQTYYQQALATHRDPPEAPSKFASVQSNFASLLRKRGHYEEAESRQREALDRLRSLTGPNSIDVATERLKLGRILLKQERIGAADSTMGPGIVKLVQMYEAPHSVLARAYHHTGILRLQQRRLEEARRLFEVSKRQAKASMPSRHPFRAYPMLGLGRVYMAQGQPETAAPLFRKALTLRQETFGEENRLVAVARGLLGQCMQQQGRYEDAESVLRMAEATLQEHETDGPQLQRVQRALMTLYEEWGRPEQATAYQDSVRLKEPARF